MGGTKSVLLKAQEALKEGHDYQWWLMPWLEFVLHSMVHAERAWSRQCFKRSMEVALYKNKTWNDNRSIYDRQRHSCANILVLVLTSDVAQCAL
jgi:hypothetical protein